MCVRGLGEVFRRLQLRWMKVQRRGCKCLCELEWVLKDGVKGIAVNAGLALIPNVSCLIPQNRVRVFYVPGERCEVTSFHCLHIYIYIYIYIALSYVFSHKHNPNEHSLDRCVAF